MRVDGERVGAIDAGLLVFLGVQKGDSPDVLPKVAAKLSKLRIFSDTAGKSNLSLLDVGGAILLISQFTLAANLKGNRPGFDGAAHPVEAESLYLGLAAHLKDLGITVETGRFGADMKVSLTNEGPATYWLEF